MRRRALLSGLLVGALAVLIRPFTVTPLLDVPLEPEEEEEDAPPTEPA